METKETNYPSELFRYRALRGMARYRQIEGNLYEDCTCTDHTPCQITVKPDGDHFVLGKLMNESANRYKYLHQNISSDSDFYDTKDKAMKAVYIRHIKSPEESIAKNEKQIEEITALLENEQEIEIKAQTLSQLDFGSPIFLLKPNDYRESSDKIERKIFDKDGLWCMQTDGLCNVYDTNDNSCLSVVYDNGGEDEERWYGFLTAEDRDAFRHNRDYRKKIKALETCKENIEWNNSQIQKLTEALEKNIN